MEKKIDIVIPSYNSIKWLPEAIESAMSQTYKNISIIVIDDGSTDGTGLFVKREYGDKIKYYRQENMGLSAARNTGITLGTGDFVQFLDADDLLHPEKLRIQAELLMANPECSIVFSDFEFFSKDDVFRTWDSPRLYKKKYSQPDMWFSLLSGNFIVCHAALIRKSALQEVGNFDTSLNACEDYDLWLRFSAQAHKFLFADRVLAYYRRHEWNMSNSRIRQIESTLKVHSRIKKLKKRLKKIECCEYRRYRTSLHIEVGKLYKQNKRFNQFKNHFIKAVMNRPTDLVYIINKMK